MRKNVSLRFAVTALVAASVTVLFEIAFVTYLLWSK